MSTVLIVCAVAVAAPIKVSNEEGRFSLAIPDGFESFTPDPVPAMMLYAYRQTAEVAADRKYIIITKVGVPLLHEQSPMAKLEEYRQRHPEGTNFTPLSAKWKEFDIPGVRYDAYSYEGQPGFVMSVQVPIDPDAIQIIVVGGKKDEKQVAAILNQMLASLEGDTNWTSEGDRQTRQRIALVVLAMTIILLTIWGRFWLRMRRRKGLSDDQEEGKVDWSKIKVDESLDSATPPDKMSDDKKD